VPCIVPPVQLKTCPLPTVIVPLPCTVPLVIWEDLVPELSASVRVPVPLIVSVMESSCIPAMVMFVAVAMVGWLVPLVMQAYCVDDG